MKAILCLFRPVLVAVALFAALTAPLSAQDSVERWNAAMTNLSRDLMADAPPGLPPFLEVRVYAMTHVAILDAVKTALKPGNAGNTDVDAAVAAAANGVLQVQFGFLPPAGGLFGSLYNSELAAIPDGPAKLKGIGIGRAAADAMLATRAGEDPFAALLAPYTPGNNPGDYQLLPPAGVAGAGWPALKTFVLKSSAQFRAAPPYALSSLEYVMDLNEISVLGKAGASARTEDQTAIAFYWYENSSFAWNEIARGLAAGKSLLEHARLFAALNAAISDAYSASLESKFHYNFWRPITAIRLAQTDGNPLTKQDATWEPAFITPPVPDYPSAHAAAGGAAAEVITALLGDAQGFSHTSPTFSELSAATRHFNSVAEAAAENAYSRMLVGIHFRRACTVGLEQGRAIGKYVIEKAKFLNN